MSDASRAFPRTTPRKGRNSPRKGSLPPTAVDKKLIPRMKECLSEAGASRRKTMSAEDIAAALQDKFADYSRKKKKPFVQQVSEAYRWLYRKEGGSGERLEDLEKRHLVRRQAIRTGAERERAVDGESDSSSVSFDSDADFELDFERVPEQARAKVSNLMNSALHAVYQSRTTPPTNTPTKGPSHQCSNLSSAPASPYANLRTDSVPTLRWTIDTQGSSQCAYEEEGVENGTPTQQGSDLPAEVDSGDQVVNVNSADQMECSAVRTEEATSTGSLQLVVSECRASPLSSLPSSPPRLTLPESSGGTKRSGNGASHEEANKKGGLKKRRLSKRDRSDKEEDGAGRHRVPLVDPDFVPSKSDVRFSDIGGNEETIQEICKLLLHLRHPEVYRQLGVAPPCGFLLHGPPGCGKTLVAHAIAGEMGLPFFKLAATEVVTGISGESEEKIRKLFQAAKAVAPCLVFLDEIDAISPKRETTQREMERRIVAQLLSCMDDLHLGSEESHVLVIGATNRPDAIDPALRRAGRFDREISLGKQTDTSSATAGRGDNHNTLVCQVT